MIQKAQQPCWVGPDTVLNEEQWQSLMTAGNVVFQDAHRTTLLQAINKYRTNSTLENAAVRPGKIKNVLKELETSLAHARSALSNLLTVRPPENRAALRALSEASALPVAGSIDPKRYISAKDIKKIAQQISDLTGFARVAASALQKDVGRGGDPNIGELLDAANAVFKDAGGTGRYTKESISFLRGVCEHAGYKVHSDDALKQALKTLAEVEEDSQ